MDAKEIANNYQRLRVRGATPVGLILLLYDAAIESLRRARIAAESGSIEERVGASNRVLLIINELTRALDQERGGKVARNLDEFYSVARALLMQANAGAQAEAFDPIIEMFFSVREAWQRVELDVDRPSAEKTEPMQPAEEQRSSLAGWSA